MARERGKQSTRSPVASGAEGADAADASRVVPDLLRKLLSVGFSGFFLTEEALRRAFGDTVPRDWVDFVSEQSERTRAEFLERLAREVGETLDRVDLAALAEQLLAGHAIEVKAEICFRPRDHKKKTQERPLKIKLASKGPRR